MRQLAVGLGLLLASGTALAAQPGNVWAGAYTVDQAARGKDVFSAKNCVSCHDEEGRPGDDGVPPIVGAYFMSRWDGQSVGDIAAFIAENMPRTRPRTLTPGEVAEVTAYLLKLNGLPAGPAPLPSAAEALRGIRFTETAPH